jgi:TfoX/Sxy family transcriptional regulator of competence genes
VGQAEDEIRIDAEDALGALDGLEVRRMFSGWGFYHHGLLFAAAWDGEFRFRSRQDGRWKYQPVDPDVLNRPEDLVRAARAVLAKLAAEPAAKRATKARRGAPGSVPRN